MDLHGLAHITGWKPYDLHDLANVSRVESVLFNKCTDLVQHFITADTRSTVDDLDREPSEVWIGHRAAHQTFLKVTF